MKKTKQQIETEVTTYLDKTSKHLFITESGYFYTVITMKQNDKLYYVTIMIGKGQVQLNVREAVSDSNFNYYGNNTTNMVKVALFPEYYKAQSIPYFKKMRNLVEEISKEVSIDNTKNQALIEKIKTKIGDLEIIK